jgi:hypothetical protein
VIAHVGPGPLISRFGSARRWRVRIARTPTPRPARAATQQVISERLPGHGLEFDGTWLDVLRAT